MRQTIFILAAGTGDRLSGQQKFNLVVEGDTLIRRTARMIGKRGILHVVSRTPAYHNYGLRQDPIMVVARDSRSTCESLVACRNFMDGRVVILLGDVYYTEKVMDDILSNRSPFCIWTDHQDIFAMAFYRSARIVQCAWEVANLQVIPNRGRLWEAYRRMIGEEGKSGIPTLITGMHRDVSDTTQDFDTPEDYENFKLGKTKNNLLLIEQSQKKGLEKGILRMRKQGRYAKASRRLLEV